jgi:MFS family permease
MVRAWEALRGFNRGTVIFLLVCALDAFGYFGIQNVLFNLYLLRLGFGPEFIGLLIASGQLLWAVAALPAGVAGQRLGIRATMILAFVLAALGMGLVLLVETLPRSLWPAWLLACWGVLWVGTALYSVNSPPYLMQVTTARTRAYAFAAQGVVLAIMGFAGSFVAGLLPGIAVARLGGSLEQASPYRFALWAAPVAYLLCALLWTGARPVQVAKPAEEAQAAPKPLGLFVFLVLMVFLQTASEGALLSFFTVYLDTRLGVPTGQIGAIVGIGQLLSVTGVLAVPHLLLRCGAPQTLKWTTLGIGLAMVPLALLPQWLPAAVGFAGVSALSAINGPVRNVLSQEIVAPRWRPTTSALLTVGLALGWASTAAIGGYLIAQAGFDKLFLISAGLALAAALLLWAYLRGHGVPQE